MNHWRRYWVSQLDQRVERAGPTACYRACRLIAANVMEGVLVPEGTQDRIQMATAELPDGGVMYDAIGIASGKLYIDTQLNNRRPVVVGVNYKTGSPNRDGITDHFLVLIGRDETTLYGLDPGRACEFGWNAEFDSESLQRTSPQRPNCWMTMVVPTNWQGATK